ncbi:MAG: PSD1 and planctomycete cytochrome C domain-containing protein [Verrucomicrobiota bacterium]|nr:PSD1 and planctomycete cytochrome C domain-containing protein [Verrucomicrobiota bacterium]
MKLLFALLFFSAAVAQALSPADVEKLPPAAKRPIDFARDIQPLFEASCVKCHGKGKDKGDFSLETREAFLKGGETGPAAVVGKSAESYVVEMVAGIERDNIMPKKGVRWTAEQVGLLRAWIDQEMPWPANITFAKPPPENLHPRKVALPPRPSVHPVDQLVAGYFAETGASFLSAVGDELFARRLFLDLIGLLPTPEELDAFVRDPAPDKRAQLVRRLLGDKRAYADHWLTFWNDLLRNDYKGAGFIDGGRRQITGWLYQALIENRPYDRFVAELVSPTKRNEGFTAGIIWRGTVNASMRPPMQAAQNVAQVFLGVNLKCASCHDSFINDWSLADAYGLAAVFSDAPLELVHCDKPTGKEAAMRFLYPEVGGLDSGVPKADRLRRLAGLLTAQENGRLARTIVNRLWARLFGRGLVEPLDDMEKPAWSRDLLDWLAEDFVTHGHDLKHTLEVLCTSHAYRLPAVEGVWNEKEPFVFRGPLAKRLSAEQFVDALSALTDDWARLPGSLEFDFSACGLLEGVQMPQWIWTDEPVELGPKRSALRAAKGQLDEALAKLTETQKSATAPGAQVPLAAEGAGGAGAQAAAALRAAQERWNAISQPRPPAESGDAPNNATADRHRVVFRKRFTLPAAPSDALAAVLSSQGVQVQVNGQEAKPKMRDGARAGRIALLDLASMLVPGENVIVVDVSSHTEKQMNDAEGRKYPASSNHLNAQSGVAFYLRCVLPEGNRQFQLGTDETWRVRRNPEGAWETLSFPDADWALARVLPEGILPVDEGPGLPPINRQDFANIPIQLGPQLSPAVSTAAQPGRIRASLQVADSLQVALDRPNREIIVPVRAGMATTIQALELTNGATLNEKLETAAAKLLPQASRDPLAWLDRFFRHSLSRPPSPGERHLALELLGDPVKSEGLVDFLWALVNLPEFQLIH